MKIPANRSLPWATVRATWRAALADGVFAPVETRVDHIEQDDVVFILRRAEALKRKLWGRAGPGRCWRWTPNRRRS